MNRNQLYSGTSKPWFRIWSDVHFCLFTRIWESPCLSGDASSPSQTCDHFCFPRDGINIQECERCELSREMALALPVLTGDQPGLAGPGLSSVLRSAMCAIPGPGPVSSLLSRIFSFTAQIWHTTTTTTPRTTTSAAGWHEWRGSVTQNVTGHDIMSHISTLILMMVMSRSIACVSWHHPGPVTMCGDRGAPLTAERLAHYQDGWSPFSSSPCHNIGGQCQAPTLLRKYERGMAATWREVTGVTVVRIYCLWEMKGGRMMTTCRFLWPLSPENVIMWSHWSPDPGLLRGHLHRGIIPWLLAPGPHYNALFAHADNFKQNCTLFLWLGASVEATLAKENSAQGCPAG